MRLGFLFFVLLGVVCAQVTTTGEIHGRILDASGASVPEAAVKLIDQNTGAEKTTAAAADGAFVFVALLPGIYRIEASAKGFQTAVISDTRVETARVTDVNVRMAVGQVSERVEVQGAAPTLQTTSNVVSTTVTNALVQDLPLNGRDVLSFGLLMPGAERGSSDRDSTFNGLPNASLNITLDGINNNSQRFKSGGTSFFVFAPLRLGAIEEVTVATTGMGADASGEGAMQLRFVTKRGTNTFHGAAFEQFRNDDLNANNWVNNARGIAIPRLRQNEFGGNFGGPLWKNKLFFFANYEENRAPSQSPSTNTVLNAAAQQGNFVYLGTDKVVHTVNVLQVAAAAGLPGTVNPVVAGLLSRMNGSLQYGNVTPNDLITNQLRWNQAGGPTERYPTARVDYNITDRLAFNGTWNLRWRDIRGTQPWPGPDFHPQSEFKSTYYIASAGLTWTVTPTMVNEFKFGVQSNVEEFNVGENLSEFNLNGTLQRISFPLGIPSIIRNNGVEPRNNPVYNLYDNVNWMKSGHTFTFGANLLRTTMWDSTFGNAGIPNFTLGVDPSDPVTSVLDTSTLPAISSNDLPNAWSLYAMLTGRISGIVSDRAVNEQSHQYANYTPLVLREAQQSWGLYFQDSWRARKSLTLNYGLRWEFSSDIHNTNGTYASPPLADLYGPSTRLFAPGQLNGVQDPQLVVRDHTYRRDYVNPAPNFGFAWNPEAERGLLGKLLGGSGATVIRGGFNMSYYQEGMDVFTDTIGENPGGTQELFLNPGMPGFTPGGLSLGSAIPPLQTFPTAFSTSFPQALFTFGGAPFATTLPSLRTPYVMNWSIGVQRSLAKNTVLEVRYVGNRGVHLWHQYNINEVNIFENGFAAEFQNAQKNLAINQAAGVTSFANQGLPGQVPLPIFQAAFGALGGQPALSAGSGFGNGTFINELRQGQAGALAGSLAGSPTYLCRMVGSALPACASNGFAAPGAYPINFFQVNPFNAGVVLNQNTGNGNGNPVDFLSGGLNLLSDDSYSTYNSLQVELRHRFSRGLSIQTSYTLAHALSDLWEENQDAYQIYTTLRNKGLDNGPSVFDVRHAWLTFWSYDLPFGAGRRIHGDGIVNGIIGGWTVGSIMRFQTGRPFRLSSGRDTFNQNDAGVVLNGITAGQLQSMLSPQPGPNRNISFVSPSLVGSDGRANPAILASPAGPGQLGQTIYLYGPNYFQMDASLLKDIPVWEKVKVRFQAEALNVLNHPAFQATSTNGGFININSTTFGQTTSQSTIARQLQLRLQVRF